MRHIRSGLFAASTKHHGVKLSRSTRAALLVAAASVSVVGRVSALSVYWQGPSGGGWSGSSTEWIDPVSHSTEAAPQDGANAFVAQSGTIGISNGIVNVNYRDPGTGLASLTIDAGNTVNENMALDEILVFGPTYVGFSNTGQYSINNGFAWFETPLYLGYGTATTGTLTMTGNGIVETGSTTVGNMGNGIVNQSGGTAELGASITLGATAGSSGQYNLSGSGNAGAGAAFIGAGGIGQYVQTGGTSRWGFVGTNGVYFGYTSLGTGTVSAGSITMNNGFFTGYGANGLFLLSGGTCTVSGGSMVLGYNQNISGTVNVSNGILSATNGALIVGHAGIGTMIQTGGTVHASSMTLGNLSTAQGSYTVSNTAQLIVDGALVVGESGTGYFNQSGGSMVLTGSGITGGMLIGHTAGGFGSVSLSGGYMNSGGDEVVGYLSTGQFTQSGGTNAVNDPSNGLIIGYQPNVSATYSLSGGLLTTKTGLAVGYEGNGNFVQTGGTNQALGEIDIGDQQAGIGAYSLSAGLLTTPNLTIGTGSQGGGTFTLSASGNLVGTTESISFLGKGHLIQTGGSNHAGQILIGFFGSAGAVYDMMGGYLQVDTGITVANGTGTAGVFNLSGGTVTTAALAVNTGGQFTQTSGTASLGTVTGSGSMTLSGGLTQALSLQQSAVNVNGGLLTLGATSVFNSTNATGPIVTSGGLASPTIISGALAISDTSKVLLNPSIPGSGVTNSFGSLTLAGGTSLDIGNHTVIVQNAANEKIVGGYLATGYHGGFWNGTSNNVGSITSLTAFNDNTGATSVGYGNSSDFTFAGSTSPYRVGGPKALSGNQMVVAPALPGDLLLTGSVGPNELSLILNAFGTTGNDWAFGNIDYDAAGSVGPNDLSLLLSNFGHSSSALVATGSMAIAAKSLAAAPRPALVAGSSDVAPPPTDGIELIVNVSNGDVELEGNLATLATSVVLTSPGNTLIGGTTFTPAFHALFDTTASNTSGLIDEFNTFANGSTVDGIIDMGNVYNAVQNSEDVQFQFSEKGINRGGLQTGSVFYVTGVPEPTTMSLLAVASGGLLGRRQRRRTTA